MGKGLRVRKGRVGAGGRQGTPHGWRRRPHHRPPGRAPPPPRPPGLFSRLPSPRTPAPCSAARPSRHSPSSRNTLAGSASQTSRTPPRSPAAAARPGSAGSFHEHQGLRQPFFQALCLCQEHLPKLALACGHRTYRQPAEDAPDLGGTWPGSHAEASLCSPPS